MCSWSQCVSNTSHGGDGARVHSLMDSNSEGIITNGINEMTSVDLCSTVTVTCP